MIDIKPPKFNVKNPFTGKDLWVRPFLVKEEKKMLTILEMGSKEEIIKCVSEILEDCYENFSSKNLATFEVDYLFNQIRTKSIGEIIDTKFICPYTEETINLNFSIDDIEIKGLDTIENKVKIDNNLMLYIKYPSYNDLVSLPENSIEYENIIDLASRCITKIYNSSEIIDVNRDQIEEVKNLLLNLTTNQFNKIIKFFENTPIYEYEYNYITSDGVERQIKISGIEDFFMFASAT